MRLDVSDALPMNCPYCGRSMTYLARYEDWLFYRCEPDGCGPITLLPGGRIRRTEESDYAVLAKPEIKKHGT